MTPLSLSQLTSPLGDLLLATDEHHVLHALGFADQRWRLRRALRERYGDSALQEVSGPASLTRALERYFAGELTALESLPTATAGTPLQERIWDALRRIPPGTTTSYGKLAKALGFQDPRAAIDVGAAIGANPIALVVPCHRVIASNGDLKGFAWGLPRKQWLLEHERTLPTKRVAPRTEMFPGF
ncbi:methylated-DNA--[protein]-cysteine S-methyltransferase [Corallococcus sp. M34]|uniref:methylated-DNA--[protein]-cysteine S-methyltransferase n=1 Tax=Citreicoccus inhibens TaxID=2849499 RepID=UPI001C2186CC|nr:methylated-DNA--[protein]-cysteine S-methyltransferase [Citreicoccus inhibens]MBU8899483.1 methylated-DNA--[protein]-cysteine S-methyltransferase [Citreicoccus inhibens]